MHILLVYIHVKTEFLVEFIAATKENAAKTRAEPECLRFDVIQEKDDPQKFVLIEAYRTLEGHASHRETPHYTAWNEKAVNWVVEARTRTIYKDVDVA